MGVGLRLEGAVPGIHTLEPQPDLRRIERWMRAHCGDTLVNARDAIDTEGSAALYVLLHPAAEEIELSRRAPGSLTVQANTSTVGPGYHIYLCGLLSRLGADLGIAWNQADDDTGYFAERDPERVYAAMLAWFQTIAGIALEDFRNGQGQSLVCLRADRHFDPRWQIASSSGPLDPEWLDAVARNPERGRDFFSWWNPEQDARYCLRRALCLMWTEVRWRAPISEEQQRVLRDTATLLERARRMDPGLDYPWREWKEILDISGAECPKNSEVLARAAIANVSRPLIGYRRYPIRVDLAGEWSIEVPGDFAESWEDERTWYSWAQSRAVRFTCFSIHDEDGRPQPAREILGDSVDPRETFESADDGPIGRAHLAHSVDEHWNLHGRTAVDGGLAVCTITIASLEDREWALHTWRSIRQTMLSGKPLAGAPAL